MESARFQFSLRTLIIVVVVFGILIGAVVGFQSYTTRMSAEYNTVSVIQATIKHIQVKHTWPKDWDSISINQNIQAQVSMRFDVTLKEIHVQPELLKTVITPVHGSFRMYPYPDERRKELWDEIEKSLQENP